MLRIDNLKRRSLVIIQNIGDIQHGRPILRYHPLTLPLGLLGLLLHLSALDGYTLIRLALEFGGGGGVVVIDEGLMGTEVFDE